MKIKNNKVNYKSFFLISIALLILFLLSFGFKQRENNKKSIKAQKKEKLDLETKTIIDTENSIINVIKEDIGIIHKDKICTIHLFKELGTPTILYVYRDSLSLEQLTDRFYLQVHLKNPTLWNSENNKAFIPLDFNARPKEIVIGDKKFFTFKKEFTHEYLDLGNVKHISTGRFKAGRGKSYSLGKIKIHNDFHIESENTLNTISISIKNNEFEKIKAKRLEAFHNRILITEEGDLVDAKIEYKEFKKLDAQIRLKGDWTDHLNDPKKWSFRLIMDNGNTINGLRKFSLQHPMVRNYLWEWMYNKAIKQSDLIGIKYDFVNVKLNIVKKDSIETIPLGIMAFEEAFDKILIEGNNRREGLLLAFDESLIWEDRNQQRELDVDKGQRNEDIQDFKYSPVKLYNESKVLSDPKLKKQFKTAYNLLKRLQERKLKVSDVFDIDKLTMFVALNNLFGGYHGLVGHNIKIYYNPVTNKLEPISWDSNSGHKIEKIHHYRFSDGDEIYTQKLIEKLELVSSTNFLNNLNSRLRKDLDKLNKDLSSEYENVSIDLSILEYNSNLIKKKIYPSNATITGLLNFDTNMMNVSIKNISDFPLIITGLIHKNGKSLTKPHQNRTILPKTSEKITFELDDSFVNAFVSKKNKKGEFRYPKDLSKMSVQFNMLGQKHKRTERISPFSKSETLDEDIDNYKNSFVSNILNFDFIGVDEKKKLITFKKGTFTLNKTLVVPAGYKVTVEKGFQLDFKDNASVISYSSFECNGTKEFPIKFYSSDSTGAGIFITSAPQTSILNHCEFTNLSNPTSDIWELSGAVNFNESTVAIKNSIFKNNRCEDGLNIIRSKFTLESSIFKDTKSDAFDGDFVDGTIANCTFINSGNDGVDVSGSKIVLDNIIFENPSDKAISAGENSAIEGSKININGGEIGIVSKDLSTVLLSDVTINDTRLGFSSFQKKSEFGPGKITIKDLKMTNIESDYLIEIGSSLTIDNIVATTVSNKVIDQMYGKEYGKSSK